MAAVQMTSDRPITMFFRVSTLSHQQPLEVDNIIIVVDIYIDRIVWAAQHRPGRRDVNRMRDNAGKLTGMRD